MKAKLLSVVAIVFSTVVFGQSKYGATSEDSVQCMQNLSLYTELVKQGSYDEAKPYWIKAMNICPASSKNLYINGVKMYRQFISKEKDPAARAALVDSLMWVYDMRIKHFGQEGYVTGRKATDYFGYNPKNAAEANAMFKKSMDLMGGSTEAAVVSGYYETLYDMFQKGEKDKAALLEAYLPVSELISEGMAKANSISDSAKRSRATDRYDIAKTSVDERFIQVGACEDIVSIFGKKVADNPKDFDLMEKTLKILSRRECTENDLFGKVAKAVHANNPSAESAYNIGQMEMNDRNYSTALDFFKQAIELSGGKGEGIESYYLSAAQASLKVGADQSAVSYANKAISVNSRSGNAYLIIAQAIAGSKCGTNEFEIKAVYWLAYDYAEKAASVDGSVSSSASRLMSAYQKQFPSKELMFQYTILGKDNVTIGCWINEKTKVREP